MGKVFRRFLCYFVFDVRCPIVLGNPTQKPNEKLKVRTHLSSNQLQPPSLCRHSKWRRFCISRPPDQRRRLYVSVETTRQVSRQSRGAQSRSGPAFPFIERNSKYKIASSGNNSLTNSILSCPRFASNKNLIAFLLQGQRKAAFKQTLKSDILFGYWFPVPRSRASASLRKLKFFCQSLYFTLLTPRSLWALAMRRCMILLIRNYHYSFQLIGTSETPELFLVATCLLVASSSRQLFSPSPALWAVFPHDRGTVGQDVCWPGHTAESCWCVQLRISSSEITRS